jgi:superfamily II DNA or RNA helicase
MEWNELAREIRAHPNSSTLLSLELARLAETAKRPIVTVGLDLLQQCTGSRTLGELASDPEVDDILRAELPRAERRAFLSAVSGELRRLALAARQAFTAKEAEGPRAVVSFDPEHVPEGGSALDAWAEHFGVAALLDAAMRVGSGRRPRDQVSMLVRQCADLLRHPNAGQDAGIGRQELRRAAVDLLGRQARVNAPRLRARSAFLARRKEPEDPWVAERVRLLSEVAEARRPSRPGDPPLALLYPAASVLLASSPPALVVVPAEGGPWFGRHEVDLARVTIKNTGYHWHGSPERAVEDHAIVVCAIDALCDPEGQALRALLEWRRIPPWKHVLGAFESAMAAQRGGGSAHERERIAFRLPLARGDVSVLVQAPRKGGATFSPGRLTGACEALSLLGLSRLEREILETIALLEPPNPRMRDRTHTRLRLLELLAAHPRVHLDEGPKEPIRLRRVRARLRVQPAEGGYQVGIAMGDCLLPVDIALERARERGILLSADANRQVVCFAEVDDVTVALLAALDAHPEQLPGEGLDALLGILSTCPGVALDLELPEQARGRPVASDRRLVVQLSLAADESLGLAVRVRPLVGSPALLPGTEPRHIYGAGPDGARVFATRDLDDEEARAEHLLADLPLGGALRRGPFDVRIEDPLRACDVVATLAELGDAIVTEWPEGERLRVVATLGPRALKLRVARRRDWFGVEGGAEAGGVTIGLHALLEAARSGRRFVPLRDGALVALGRELRARLTRADDVLHDTREGIAAYPPAVAALCELVDDERQQLDAGREWLDLRARMERARSYEPESPAGLTTELRPYQMEGYRWLMRLAEWGTGACLADDMGLGKTLQSLAVLEARRRLGPALVVAPMSVCANWAAEAARFAPGLSVSAYRGAGRHEKLSALGPGSVLVASYEVMVRDIEALVALDFATAVFDEAHGLKNGNSQRSMAARRVRAGFRVALTGTPIENHSGELWSLFRVVEPGLFGSWERFRDRFAAPIERDRDPARRAALASIVRPYLLRRTKQQVAPELPPRTEVVRFVDLSPAERELYELERAHAIEALQTSGAGEEARIAVLAALTRLRQLACHPRLRNPESPTPSSKLRSVLTLVEELRDAGHRVLVFSQFTGHLALIAEALRARGVAYFELDGSTPEGARTERVRRFQAGEGDAFLISLKAGGLGLNLTAADYVLHLDPWWNPAAEDQASDRAHRIGQDKPVTVVRLISRATIEERVLSLHAEKRELAEALLSGGDVAARLTTRELLALIEGGADAESEQEESDEMGGEA